MLNNSRYNQTMMQKSVDISNLKTIFWDIDFETLSWEANQDFIIQRVLTHGTLDMIRWLRQTIGNAALAAWIQERQGRGLSPQQLRYWEVMLGLPVNLINRWIQAGRQSTWGQRVT